MAKFTNDLHETRMTCQVRSAENYSRSEMAQVDFLMSFLIQIHRLVSRLIYLFIRAIIICRNLLHTLIVKKHR